jgi:hypothetical protein
MVLALSTVFPHSDELEFVDEHLGQQTRLPITSWDGSEARRQAIGPK